MVSGSKQTLIINLDTETLDFDYKLERKGQTSPVSGTPNGQGLVLAIIEGSCPIFWFRLKYFNNYWTACNKHLKLYNGT